MKKKSSHTNSTTSTLSVGSTGSQARLIQSSHPPAHYQPVLMKDLGKSQSPKQDKNVVDLFSDRVATGGTNSSGDESGSGGSCDVQTDTDSDTVHNNTNKEQKLTDSVMDKHLCALVDDSLNFGGAGTANAACDIAKYMANLKKKHMESEQYELDEEMDDSTANIVAASADDTQTESSDSGASATADKTTQQSEEDSGSSSGGGGGGTNDNVIILDNKVDKASKKSERQRSRSEHKVGTVSSPAPVKSTLRSPSTSTHLSSHSPDRSRSTGTSPVKIIKIRSPRNSIVDTSGRRLNVSRESLKDGSPDRREVSPRRGSEGGGILKRSVSPKPVTVHTLMPSSSSCSSSASSTGILKRSQSPAEFKAPDRNRLSPRESFESRSPDRYRNAAENSGSYCSSRAGSFDSRASEPNLDIPRSVLKQSSNCGGSSFESRSPDRSSTYATVGRKRSLSAHSSVDPRSPEPYDHYYQFYQQQMEKQYSPDRRHQRLSKSLERSGAKDYADIPAAAASHIYGRYGLSPERIYHIGPPPPRSQSAENAYRKYGNSDTHTEYGGGAFGGSDAAPPGMYDLMHSNESLTKSIEQPTCVECLYQRKPS